MATDPYTIVAAALEQIVLSEFSELAPVPVKHDKIHEALGRADLGGRVVGISPIEFARARDANVQETWAEVRFWNTWPKELKPTAEVDPRIITGYATRFQDALRVQQVTSGGTGHVWYFDVMRVRFPDDPTGNKSRFIADVRAFGNNQGIVETA